LKNLKITEKELELINSKDGLVSLLNQKKWDLTTTVNYLKYKQELEKLQAEFIDLQIDVKKNNRRVAIIFEGRDAAGKGDAIKRFRKHSNPRWLRIVSFPTLSDVEKKQWYFKRYVEALPNPGEIVLFDRSWYSRAVVEPVNNFCSLDDVDLFYKQVNPFEKLLVDGGLELIKLWFSVTKESQASRLKERETLPLEKWMYSPLDKMAQEQWDSYTEKKLEMFRKTNTDQCPWIIIKSITRKISRVESLRYVLGKLDYLGKGSSGVNLSLSSDSPYYGSVSKFVK
jgi:polyphosphate kinase 2